MSKIDIKNLVKYFGTQKILHGIDISISKGEFCVLVGPSGCGKSTTLRMVAGLETISGGEIIIGDRIVNGLKPRERGIAMVFQNYALYPAKTVYNNMAFSLQLSRINKKYNRSKSSRGSKNIRYFRSIRQEASNFVWWATSKSCNGKSNCERSRGIFI